VLLCVALACVTLPNHSSTLPTALLFRKQEKPQAPRNERLRKELLRMRDDDQAARQRWTDAKFSEQASREMIALDEKHTARLRTIFKEHGFPASASLAKMVRTRRTRF
jgi:predicted negative regulator of RcsB-dependent stress response